MSLTRPLALLATVAAAVVALTACEQQSTESSIGIRIVASTNVYGDLARTIGSGEVTVTSIIDDPSKDPHEYQADARSQLAVSKADLVIRNGGGYDDFIDTMIDAANDEVPVIDAVALSGFDTEASDFNEHVWYDYPTMARVVDEIADELGRLDPRNAEQFDARADQLRGQLDALIARAEELSQRFAGTGVAITEPVPLYLVEALGLENLTPSAFSEAVEDDTDVPPSVLRETLGLFSDGVVALLVYNPQTAGPQTDAVLGAAEDAGVPAVAADELLPASLDYVDWQNALIDDIEGALA